MNKNLSPEEFEMNGLEHEGIALIDIREQQELEEYALSEKYGVQHFPLSQYGLWKENLSPKSKYLFICKRGVRSRKLVEELRKYGQTNCFSLRGGIEGLKDQ